MNLPHADKNAPDYLPALHGLRGIAVLYVVISHLGNGGLFLLPFSHEAIGKVGVWIFFSLSAFLLTLNLYRDLEANASRILSVLQYTLHRIFRIYPLYILVLVCHVILGDISDTDFFEHLVLTQGSGELWAIPVEFQYYLMIPLTVVIALYLPLKYCSLLLTVAIIAVLLCGVKQPAIIFSNELNITPKLTPFIFGGFLALLASKSKFGLRNTAQGLSSLIPLLSLAGLLVSTVLYRSLSKNYLPIFSAPWISLLISLSAIGLIYSALQLNFVSKFLRLRLLVLLGKISFSIYLLHIFVIRFIQKSFDFSTTAEAWLSLCLSVLCAFVTYLTIEQPGIHVGKIIGKKLRRVALYRRES